MNDEMDIRERLVRIETMLSHQEQFNAHLRAVLEDYKRNRDRAFGVLLAVGAIGGVIGALIKTIMHRTAA